MCVKAVSTDVNSSLLMDVLRTCPWILPARVALGNISKGWRKDGQRCVALCRVPAVLQMLTATFWEGVSTWGRGHGGEQWPSPVLQAVAVVALYSDIKQTWAVLCP